MAARLPDTRLFLRTVYKNKEILKVQSRLLTTTSYQHAQDGSRTVETKKPNDKYEESHRKRMANYYSMFLGSFIGIGGSSYLIYKRMNEAKAESSIESAEDGSDAVVKKQKDGSGAIHKSEAGFKERKVYNNVSQEKNVNVEVQIIDYENRVRAYSTPDKIFRYFATLQDYQTGEIYMTPEDFVRALTPDTMQPPGLGLDQFKKIDNKNPPSYKCVGFGEGSVFHCFGDGGLITFSDYLFLVTSLGTSPRQIEIAFKMFDLNGDGEVTLEEFKKVRSLFLNMTTTGSRHRDRKTTGNVLHDEVSTGLAHFLFGEDGKRKLTSESFVQFKSRLQQEIMYLEFASFHPKDGKITAYQFAEILLTYANVPVSQSRKTMKRINAEYGSKGSKRIGITFQDYLDFFSFILNIRDVEMALSFHTVAGQAIDKATLKQVAKTVAGVELQDHIVDIVFSIFDENGDNRLSNKEFISVMKDKMLRGLNKPKDTGFTRLISAMWTCASSTVLESWSTASHPH